jgi:hypothetical protein
MPRRSRATGVQLESNELFLVHVVEHRARELITIAEDHPVWTSKEPLSEHDCEGKIVRLRPPPGTPAEWTDAVVASLRGHAVAVRVVPPVLAPAVVPAASVDTKGGRLTPRDVVTQLASEARMSNPADLAALVAMVASVMDEEGL